MSRVFIIRDPRGERRLTDSDLPFSLGRGPGVTIALPDPQHHRAGQEQVLGWIAYSEDHAFIQPADDVELYQNRRRINASNWLKSGDSLESGGGQMTWEVKGDQVFIRSLDDPRSVGSMAEMSVRNVPGDARDEPMPAPILNHSEAAARPLPRVGSAPKEGHKIIKGLLIVGLILLMIAAAFVLMATPLEIRIQPPPDHMSVEGFPPTFKLGDRRLALPGSYTIRAEKAGYRPLEETLLITPGDEARRSYTLRELPGRLLLRVVPAVSHTLLVDQRPVEYVPGQALALDSGNHTLVIESQRHLPEARKIQILGKGEEQHLRVELEPAWARITLRSEPPGAQIRVGDQTLGQTPKTLELLQGKHLIRFSKDLYKPQTLTLDVMAGQDRDLAPMVLSPTDGVMQLDSRPSGATVMVDDAYMGITPVTLHLPPHRQHTLKLSRPGHMNREARITLEPAEVKKLDLKLNPSYGIVFLKTKPADAELLIDGKPAGKASRRLRLPTRAHALTVRKQGFMPEHLWVMPKAGSAQRFNITLTTTENRRATARR